MGVVSDSRFYGKAPNMQHHLPHALVRKIIYLLLEYLHHYAVELE